jgi:hypothetical protein
VVGQALGSEQAGEALPVEDGGHVLHAVAAGAREERVSRPARPTSETGAPPISSRRSRATRSRWPMPSARRSWRTSSRAEAGSSRSTSSMRARRFACAVSASSTSIAMAVR